MILWFIMTAWSAGMTCSVGSEANMELVEQFHKEELTDDDSFLRAYRSWRALKQTPGLRQLLPDNKISPVCIKTSMKRISNISAKRKVCTSSSDSGQTIRLRGVTPTSKFMDNDKVISNGMCMTDDLLDYVSWGFSSAVDCINSLPTNQKNKIQLNPHTIFELFNLESAFGFYLYSTRGQGVGQLTTSGVGDYLPNERFHFFLDEIATSTEPSCFPFKSIVEKPVLLSQGKIRHCQFLSLSEGLGRNLLISSLHLANKKWEVISLLKKYGYKKVPNRIIDQLVFIAYSRHGVNGVSRILRSRPQLETMSENTFYLTYKRPFPYLREVRDKTLGFLKEYNQEQDRGAKLSDFTDGLCAN